MSHYNLSKHGSVTKPAPSENNSFERAVIHNMKDSIEKHLSHVKIDQNQLNHALMLSIENFRLEDHADECMLILLRHKANPNCEVNMQTPLTAACKKGQELLVKTLLQNGAKPDLCNSKGEHPLQIILFDRRDNFDVATTLINALPSVNLEFRQKPTLVCSVQKQSVKIYQALIEKGASLTYQNQNILHIILKRKFKKVAKKKKFLKELTGRIYLIQQDSYGKFPIQYQQNQEIQAYYAQIFKPKLNPKIEKQTNNTGSKNKNKEMRQALCQKQIQTGQKQIKKKPKDLDVSFSEVDDDDYQDEKGQGVEGEKKLTEVIEIPEEDFVQEKKELSFQQQKEKNNKENKSNEDIKFKDKDTEKSLSNNSDVCLEQIQTNSSTKNIQDEKEKTNKKFSTQQTQTFKTHINSSVLEHKKGNKKYTKKNSQQDFIIKNLTKRKNSSFEEEINTSIKLEKNKNYGKKINMKKQIQEQGIKEREKEKEKQKQMERQKQRKKEIEKDKKLQQQLKQVEEEEKKVLQAFEKVEKMEKQSETDSQESYHGDIATLSQEIFELVNKINQMNLQKRQVVQNIIGYLETAIKHQLEQDDKNVRVDLYVYGSQATGLAVEHSDVDLLMVSELDCMYLMRFFEDRKVLDLADITEVKFILSASMPVIKIRMSPRFQNMHVDLTFQTKIHMGLKCCQTIQSFMQAEPLLRPLVLIIKTLVHKYKLSDPYKGGIGSYGVTLMVIALLQFTESQKKKEENIGQLLLNFFYFYGVELDYICQAIIVHELGYSDQTLYSIYRLPYLTDLNPKLIIYDPLNPVNNVGRTTYRISAIKKLFSISYFRLKGNPPCHLNQILDGSFLELVEEY